MQIALNIMWILYLIYNFGTSFYNLKDDGLLSRESYKYNRFIGRFSGILESTMAFFLIQILCHFVK